MSEPMKLVGRVLSVEGLIYTVTSVSTLGWVHVYDPRTKTYWVFDTLDAFENWAYGKPVPSGGAQP